jgi:Peptidase S24-like
MQERRKNQPGRGERRRADAHRIADALKRRGRISLHVQGDGMMPFVQPGDVALVRRGKLENMRSGDVVLLQRGNHLIAQRIGEGEDFEAENSGDASGPGEQQECLGQIMRVQRKAEEIDLTARKTAINALVSRILRPAKWAKETLHLSDEASR